MGRQSLRSPFPIAVRTSSVNAETTMYDERSLPRKASQGTMRMASERSRMVLILSVIPAEFLIKLTSCLLCRLPYSSWTLQTRPSIENSVCGHRLRYLAEAINRINPLQDNPFVRLCPWRTRNCTIRAPRRALHTT